MDHHVKTAKKNVIKFILGIKLKQLRKKSNLSLKELAEKSGLSASYLNEIEKGKKYPKLEKINAIADVLKVSADHLSSTKLGKSLHPLTEFVESELFNKFPAEMFGINDQDIYDLMSNSPEKFSSFLVAVLELARSYDITVDNILQSVLRSYQESYNNYFVDLENLSLQARDEFGLNENNFTSTQLKEVLIQKFDYVIDEESLSHHEQTKSTRSYFKAKKGKNIFLLNKDLTEAQKKFTLGKELGICYLGVRRKEDGAIDFAQILGDFRASYFSGALSLPAHSFVKDLKEVFQNKSFKEESFLNLLIKYGVSSEVLMHRMTQILPEYFGLNQLYFLRCTNDFEQRPNAFKITRELHLAQMHAPHGQRLKEHYCRRWVTITLLKDLAKKMTENKNDVPLLGIQRSLINGQNVEYFCVSIARPSKIMPETNSCITIGILMDDYFKRQVSFWNDESVTKKLVGQTCERCNILDCNERAEEPTIVLEQATQIQKSQFLSNLVKDM